MTMDRSFDPKRCPDGKRRQSGGNWIVKGPAFQNGTPRPTLQTNALGTRPGPLTKVRSP